ncbi:MAG: hypothetical protein J7J02_06550 [Sulfurovum sp.]|nr:hypothetical protein [Sulfurovum sp.]
MPTQNSSKSKQWFKRIIITVVLLELAYLVVFNILLNTTFVQKQINTMEPEKFQLQWESAWTPYPSRIYIKKLTAKGKLRSKEWQVDMNSVSASLSLLSLLEHKVKMCNVEMSDISYTEQPNLSAGTVQSTAMQKKNVDTITTMASGNDGERKPWDIELRGLKIHGHHTVETNKFKGELDGDIDTDLVVRTKDSLLSIEEGKINIAINTLRNHKGQEIIKQGKIKSVFKISPVNFREKRRGELLKYLTLDSTITAQMSGKGVLESQIHLSNGKLSLVIPPVIVDDLSLIQKYVPEKWGVAFYRGKGMLQGKVNMNEEELNATIKLSSKDAEIGFNEQRVQSELDMLIKVKVSTAAKLHADLAGTHIVLSNTKLSSQKESNKKVSKPWNTNLKIEQGSVMLSLPDNNSSKALFTIFKKYKIKDIFAGAEGKLKVRGDISQLDWVNLLMKSSLDFSVSGSGVVEADLLIKNASLAKKSMAKIRSKNLQVGLLDYRYSGDGEFTAEKTEGGGASGVIYALDLSDATMKREGEKEAKIVNVVMRLDGGDSQDSREDKALRLQILSAKVKNVSLYNQYFPENSPFVFVDGSADLSADILLESNSTKGYVKFMTDGLTMKVNEQIISGRLRVNTKIVAGEPKKMKFDISGSTIVLDQAKVSGKNAHYSKDDWRMAIKLEKADIVWKKPLELKSKTLLFMKDSRPIVAMIDNKKAKFALISKLLIAENLRGEVMLDMKDNAITIPYALVKSNKLDIGVKGIITPTLRNGMFFFGRKNIRAAIEIRDAKKSIDIFSAKQSFDNYVIPSPLLK